MATHSENVDFMRSIMSSCLLDDAIDWIRGNLHPDEVFYEPELKEWAIDWCDNHGKQIVDQE